MEELRGELSRLPNHTVVLLGDTLDENSPLTQHVGHTSDRPQHEDHRNALDRKVFQRTPIGYGASAR